MKKTTTFLILLVSVMVLTACSGILEVKPEVNIDNVPWSVKMGINYLDDRSAMVEFTNNTKNTVIEIELDFKLKDSIEAERLDEFYSHLKSEYKLTDDVVAELREQGVIMESRVVLDEEEYLKEGDKVEETLLYGYKFIRNLDYYDLFEPEMYKIEYINELGEEKITYYDYLNKTYTEK